jgi:hypothetical protein
MYLLYKIYLHSTIIILSVRIKNYRKKRQVIATTVSVHKELKALGLLHKNCPLLKVEVRRQFLPALTNPGFFQEKSSYIERLLGYYKGNIYVSPFCIIDNLFFWESTDTLRELIRHEYGHAFAFYYPKLIFNSKEFENVFGGNYDYYEPSLMEEEAYVSYYAQTEPGEDFAETFSEFLLRQGVLSQSITNPKLIAKWHFVDDVIKKAIESH